LGLTSGLPSDNLIRVVIKPVIVARHPGWYLNLDPNRGPLMSCRIAFYGVVLITAANIQIPTASAADARPDGVRLTTEIPAIVLNQGETIVNTLDVQNAVAGQKIRIQNSNHGASVFTTNFKTAMQAAAAAVPGTAVSLVTEQQMEITLAAGTYQIPIKQTITTTGIPGTVDDASWAPGTQLQADWLLSSAPANGAAVENDHAVVSKWITYTSQGGAPPAQSAAPSGTASDARWTLLRSVPNIGTGGTVTFEIDLTNHTLAAPAGLRIAFDGESTAKGWDFKQGLDASIAAALKTDISYAAESGILTFGPKATFPFTFAMTAASVTANKDFILDISENSIGEIDVARAGVRLGELTVPPHKPMLGVNEASGEFGVGNINFKYAYPGSDRVDWAAAQGFGMLRVPFLFQNIQAASSMKIDEGAMRALDPVVTACASRRVVCLLDMHNYGSYTPDEPAAGEGPPGTIGFSNKRLAHLWAQIADRYKNNAYVWFDLMNEPNKQSALAWVKTSNAIAAAIRLTGASNTIVFQGTAWDGAWTWQSSGNATQMLKAYDPGNNFAFEAHQYLDRDGSGTSPTCIAGAGAARLEPFTAWLQKYGLHGIIGEVGWATNPDCTTEGTALLQAWQTAATSTAAGGYIGLTYWAAGPWWPDSYMYLAEPRPFPSGAEPIQLKTLKSFVPR
jgi:endoglucanase